MDYRKTLLAYIEYVGQCEGVDFLPADLDGLTNEENLALNEAAAEVGCTDKHRARLLKHVAMLRGSAR